MRFSVIMPTYGQGAFIEESIRSVLGQEEVDLELLVRDALSTDETPTILCKYARDRRLQVVRKSDEGQVDALNQGLSEADGDILCWLNSDDLFLPGALKSVHETFMACPEVDFVYGDALEIDESGKITSPNIFTERPDQDRYVNSHNFICQPTCFFRRSVWQALGPIRKEMKWTFDYDLFGRFFREGFVAERAEAFLAANRSHAETKTSQGLAARYGEIWRMVNRLSDVPFWRRKSLLIYAAELVIKYLQQWRGKKTGVRADLANRNLNRIHLAYHKLVDPREREGIVERYNRLLRERGWIRCSDWLSEMEGESRWTEVGRY